MNVFSQIQSLERGLAELRNTLSAMVAPEIIPMTRAEVDIFNRIEPPRARKLKPMADAIPRRVDKSKPFKFRSIREESALIRGIVEKTGGIPKEVLAKGPTHPGRLLHIAYVNAMRKLDAVGKSVVRDEKAVKGTEAAIRLAKKLAKAA